MLISQIRLCTLAKIQIKKDARNRTIEFNLKVFDDEDATVEGEHIEFVNALIDLTEAKDALDLANGYGFASHEPYCPTSYIAE